jgi:hypothetical protein
MNATTATTAPTPIKPLAPAKPKAPEATNGAEVPTKAAKAPKEPKAPKAPKESNFKKVYPDTAVITLLTPDGANPKRKGSAAYDRFAFYKNGITVADAVKAGVMYADISWDVGHGFISVAK